MTDAISNLTAHLRLDSNSFTPTDAHRKAKAAFWAYYFSSGEVAPTLVDAASAARISGYSTVLQWWQEPGFSEWFQNGEEFRQKVEYVSTLSLDVIQAVLQNPHEKTSDRLNAAKMALEIAAKFPKSQPKEQFADEKIGEMGKKELEDFISSKLKLLDPK